MRGEHASAIVPLFTPKEKTDFLHLGASRPCPQETGPHSATPREGSLRVTAELWRERAVPPRKAEAGDASASGAVTACVTSLLKQDGKVLSEKQSFLRTQARLWLWLL